MQTLTRLLAAALVTLSVTPAATQDRPRIEAQFQAWLSEDLWPEAAAAGVSRAVFDGALAAVKLDWSLPELQPPGAPVTGDVIEWQAEFRSPASYFDEGGLRALVRQGREQLAEWRTTLTAIEARYGVPAEIIVAIWGKETHFGTYPLPELAVHTLATQAFMGRRPDLFRRELIAALTILENGDIAPERMRSSWAGGLGQPQFLPSSFLQHAVDFSGDGHRDIWDSVPDTLASIANFLSHKGWRSDRGVQLEARVPPEVPCALEGPDQGRRWSDWASLGVTQATGAPLPLHNRLGYLLMPAGRYGPAFLVSENFYVLKEYNRSDLYALYVSHLADRFTDDRPFQESWRSVDHFNRGDVRQLQEALQANGHNVGDANGLIGYQTRVAVGLTQHRLGMAATCLPDAALIAGTR